MSRTLKGRNKNRKVEEASPGLPLPTENQMDHALAAFAKSKLRHRLIQVHEGRIAVHILPDDMIPTCEFLGAKVPPLAGAASSSSYDVKYFTDEASARQWREREIIREAITAGMRAKP